MQCPNCKKDLVAGSECEPCKAILNPQPVIEEVVVPEKETKVAKVKRVAKAVAKRVIKRKVK